MAAVLLARFLAAHAEDMRKDLAGGNFAAARKRVNGGAHGLDKSGRTNVLNSDRILTATPEVRIDAAHGSFDNDVDVISTTLGRIRGDHLLLPVDDLRGF